jgi:hypothetical protein
MNEEYMREKEVLASMDKFFMEDIIYKGTPDNRIDTMLTYAIDDC